MRQYVYAEQFYYANEVKGPGYLEIKGDKFGLFYQNKPSGGKVTDFSGHVIAPGLVDTHIHGYNGNDVMDGTKEALESISKDLVSTGVTSYLPTTLTASTEELSAVCELVGEQSTMQGAKIQGLFLEGPFFNEKYKGAQNPNYMSDPSIELFEKWQNLAQGKIKKIALAPERKGSNDFIKHVTESGVRVALGHSDATFDRCEQAFKNGASVFVHTFNGMRGFHHREPGIAGAALTLDDVYAELICDGYHVHPQTAKLVKNARGTDQTILITDCMRGGGLPDGPSKLGEFDVMIKEGAARLVSDGNLAGSVLTLNQAIKNVVEWGIATVPEAIHMATYVPAKSIGLEHLCGQIKTNMKADFIVLDDKLALHATYVNGESAYKVVL